MRAAYSARSGSSTATERVRATRPDVSPFLEIRSQVRKPFPLTGASCRIAARRPPSPDRSRGTDMQDAYYAWRLSVTYVPSISYGSPGRAICGPAEPTFAPVTVPAAVKHQSFPVRRCFEDASPPHDDFLPKPTLFALFSANRRSTASASSGDTICRAVKLVRLTKTSPLVREAWTRNDEASRAGQSRVRRSRDSSS